MVVYALFRSFIKCLRPKRLKRKMRLLQEAREILQRQQTRADLDEQIKTAEHNRISPHM